MIITAIGLLAGTLTSIAAIPQVIKTIKSQHVRDISIWQPLLLTIGVALWMIYGILMRDRVIIISNIVPLFCNALLTSMKIHYDRIDSLIADSNVKDTKEKRE